MTPKPAVLQAWNTFASKLKELYPPVDAVADAKTRLNNLRQIGGLLNFLSELESLAAVAGIDNLSKELFLRQGVKSHLLARTAGTGSTYTTYEALRTVLLNIEKEEAKQPHRQPSGLRGGGGGGGKGGGSSPPRKKKSP